MTTKADEFGVPRVPPGQYAVPDPDSGRLTLWSTKDGFLVDFPEGSRWRPVPPEISLRGEERQAAREHWYADTYWPWRRAVAEAVLADPAGAADAFRRRADSTPLPANPRWPVRSDPRKPARVRAPRPPGKSAADRQRRAEERLLATALQQEGKSVRQLAAVLGLSKSAAGRRLVGDSPLVPSGVVARALLLVRLADLEAMYQQSTAGVDPGERERALSDLAELREALRGTGGSL